MKAPWSKEAWFFAKTLPIMVGIALFLKIPLIVFAVVAIVEVICYIFRGVFEGSGVEGNVGVATYVVYPVLVVGRFLLAFLVLSPV